METWFLLLTPDDGLLAHFEKVDERWVGLHQLFRLGRFQRKTSRKQHEVYIVAESKTLLKCVLCSEEGWGINKGFLNTANHICVAISLSLCVSLKCAEHQ